MTAIMARSECRAQTGKRSSWWHQSVHILHHSFFLIENCINYISYCFLLSKQMKNHNPLLTKVKRHTVKHRDAVVGFGHHPAHLLSVPPTIWFHWISLLIQQDAHPWKTWLQRQSWWRWHIKPQVWLNHTSKLDTLKAKRIETNQTTRTICTLPLLAWEHPNPAS